MHPSLTTPEQAAERLAADTWVHLVRQAGRAPALVRVAVPETWDAAAFAAALAGVYAGRGMADVQVMTVPTAGEPRLLGVVPR